MFKSSSSILSSSEDFSFFMFWQIEQQSQSCKFEQEIREEQEEKKRQAEEAKERKRLFKEKAAAFNA